MHKESILSYLDSCEAEMFSLLQRLVLQESYTLDKKGVDSVGLLIREALQDCGMTIEVERQADFGDHLLFRSAGCLKTKVPAILLVGHMDTVFPREMGFNCYREDDNNVYGPGVIDMKGGLVTAIYAIKALFHTGLLEEIPLTLICNSDEEKGSPSSKKLLRREAAKSLLALVFECGGLGGKLVSGRKGKLGLHIRIKGEGGHAAFADKNKASSVLELAHKTIALEALNNTRRQLLVNVGSVRGGIGPNTVAEKAEAQVDCRFLTEEDGKYCFAQVKKIVENCRVSGTSATYEIPSSRAVMEATAQNRELQHLFKKQAKQLNLPMGEELRSGVSDANTLAGCGIPVLDGLGPIGEHDHSNKEYMIKESLPARTKLTALALVEIYQRQIR